MYRCAHTPLHAHTPTERETVSVQQSYENKPFHINHIYPLLFLSWPSIIPPHTLSSILPCSGHLCFLSSIPPLPLIHPLNWAHVCHVFIPWWKDQLSDSCQSERSWNLPITINTHVSQKLNVWNAPLGNSCQVWNIYSCPSSQEILPVIWDILHFLKALVSTQDFFKY